MSDQCRNCVLIGDILSCQKAECFQHENWYAIQLNGQISALLDRLRVENDETGHELVAAKATIAEQAELIAKHEKLTSEDLHIEKLNYEDGRLDIRGTHPLASALIAEVVSIFVSGGSENYFEMQGYHPQTGPMTFTIQRTEGKSPGQVAHECREELRLLKEKVGI